MLRHFPSYLALSLFVTALVALGGAAHAEDANGWAVETTPAAGTSRAGQTHGPPYSEAGYTEGLMLREAVGRALAHHPAIASAHREIEAQEGEAYQSGLRPNPELLLEVENFAGSKDKSSFDAAEETASLTQLIELGDKRFLRLQAANLDTSLAAWDLETVRVQIATQAAQLFIDVLTAQNRVKVLGDFVGIAEKTRKSVAARVTAGKASPIELDRALVAAARAKALEKAERTRVETAKR
ncbi:MAG: TolC family protein, partial [Hyphomicrobium sp.]